MSKGEHLVEHLKDFFNMTGGFAFGVLFTLVAIHMGWIVL